ncbi:retinoid-inducible serine carboxypeptidase-like [Anoplophora glabripennis]|uniref:retinoid-inducible serine carboxypeptidase-like n=1 Tax=Anoplophora glabripennis TaxID=217634 RepID=UPI000873B037|nr:retinoid-inducible serine carboxypeptidase-like [Anoplophora glabripennis]
MDTGIVISDPKEKQYFNKELCFSQSREGFGPTDQEWGFVTVRENAHIFWWLHYTTADAPAVERPLVIWLQGGPGGSSTGFGNFGELGPLDENLNVRNTSWDRDVNVLFVDNPVGTGYSYVDIRDALTTTNRQIAEDFVEFLKGFYQAVPSFKEVPVYIFCESYGGKMTAEIALVLYQEIQKGNIESKLKGIGLGDSWISPVDSVLTWAPYLLNIGAVDQNGFEAISQLAQQTKAAVDEGNFLAATDLWGQTEMSVYQYTYGVDFYNILRKISSSYKAHDSRSRLQKPGLEVRDSTDDKINVLMNGRVKKALNISQTWDSSFVFEYLEEDFMKPVTDIVEELLNTTDIKIAIYNGQLDLIVDTPGTMKWVNNLRWEGKDEWDATIRNGFSVDYYFEGNVKKSGNLAVYWVDRSGHMFPEVTRRRVRCLDQGNLSQESVSDHSREDPTINKGDTVANIAISKNFRILRVERYP